MKFKLSIVICTYNRASLLEKALFSLTGQSDKNFEVIIIDGGSSDATNGVIKKFKHRLQIKKIVSLEKELAKVRDIGWRKTRAPLVAWIDDDVVVSVDWVKSLIEVFDDQLIGGVSGPTIIPAMALKQRDVFSFYDRQGIIGILGKIWNHLFLEGGRYQVGKIFRSGAWSPGSNFRQCLRYKKLIDVDYLEACNMTIRRKLVKKVGGFDYGYRGIAEWCELDLAQRVKALGVRLVFCSKVRLDHYVSRGGVFNLRSGAKDRMENFLRFYFNHIFRLRWGHFWRFCLYLIFLNGYWIYKAFSTRNLDWVGGNIGMITGMVKYAKS